MAEQNQTNVFADFTVTPSVVAESKPIILNQEKEKEEKEIDPFKGFTVTETETTTPVKTEDNVFSGFTVDNQPLISSTPQKTKEYSAAAKIRYGIDKQNTFFGNVYRVTKAGVQAAFDPEKDFKDYIKYNYEKEQLKLKQKYGELASGAYDDDNLVKAAEIATFMTDPFYILAYMTPWAEQLQLHLKD